MKIGEKFAESTIPISTKCVILFTYIVKFITKLEIFNNYISGDQSTYSC